MRQFLRNARVLVGVGEKALQIDGLRMRFEAVKHQFSNRLPNSMELKIYNLSKDSRERITDHGERIRLAVGYGEALRVLFTGDLRHAVHQHEDTEWISTLYCADQYLAMAESQVRLTVKAGVPVRSMIEQVAKSFGSAANEFKMVGLDKLPLATLTKAVFSGPTRTAMDQLGETYGFGWGFQDERLEIWGSDPNFEDQAIEISSATGMIGSPVVTELGLEVSTLLNPAIRVHRKIIIKSVGAGIRIGQIETRKFIPALHPGTYVVGEVISTGDTWGNEWISKIRTYKRRPASA